MKLKVCGMKYKDNIEAVATIQPDLMGFIFYNKSSRYFEGIIPSLPKSIKKVGVFVDNDNILDMAQKILNYKLDMVQLHGSESPKYCQALKILDIGFGENQLYKRHKFQIIKVFSIKDDFDFSQLQPYEGIVDYYLFDTKGKHPGGNGTTFNWDVLNEYPSSKPYFLSGGIGLEELEQLKEFQNSRASTYCYAIDVNSKFEEAPGLKNIDQLKLLKHDMNAKH